MGKRLAVSSAIVALAIAAAIGRGTDLVEEEAHAWAAPWVAGNGWPAASARGEINRLRADNGRARLRYSRSLTRSATRHARYMARHGFGHLSTIRASRAFRTVAELILRDRWGHGPATAVSSWANSPPHRSIMLRRRYRSIGIGSVGHEGVTYWVAHLGRR